MTKFKKPQDIIVTMLPETKEEWIEFLDLIAEDDFNEHKKLINSWNSKSKEELIADYNKAKSLLLECAKCAKLYEDDAVAVIRIGKRIIDNHREEYDRLIRYYTKTRNKSSKDDRIGLLQKRNNLINLINDEIANELKANKLSQLVYWVDKHSSEYGTVGYKYLADKYIPSVLSEESIKKIKWYENVDGFVYAHNSSGWQIFQCVKEVEEAKYIARALANRLGIDCRKEIDFDILREVEVGKFNERIKYSQYAGWYPTELLPSIWSSAV